MLIMHTGYCTRTMIADRLVDVGLIVNGLTSVSQVLNDML